MSTRLWLFGAVFASIAIVALGWFLGISPKLAETDTALATRVSIEAQNDATVTATAELEQQFASIDKLRAELAKLQVAIPNEAAVDELFNRVVIDSAATGVSIKALIASEGAVYGGSVDPAAAGAVQPVAGAVAADPNGPTAGLDAGLVSRFYTVGISLTVNGSADQVFALAQALQMGSRLFLITDVAFAGEGGIPSGTLTGFVYVVRDQASVPAAG